MTSDSPSVGRAGRGAGRLTRRGRLVLLLTLLVLVLGAFFFGRVSSSASETNGASQTRGATGPSSYDYVVVDAGDTLWSIARAHSAGDPRAYVKRLVELNGLEGVQVRLGQRLALPR